MSNNEQILDEVIALVTKLENTPVTPRGIVETPEVITLKKIQTLCNQFILSEFNFEQIRTIANLVVGACNAPHQSENEIVFELLQFGMHSLKHIGMEHFTSDDASIYLSLMAELLFHGQIHEDIDEGKVLCRVYMEEVFELITSKQQFTLITQHCEKFYTLLKNIIDNIEVYLTDVHRGILVKQFASDLVKVLHLIRNTQPEGELKLKKEKLASSALESLISVYKLPNRRIQYGLEMTAHDINALELNKESKITAQNLKKLFNDFIHYMSSSNGENQKDLVLLAGKILNNDIDFWDIMEMCESILAISNCDQESLQQVKGMGILMEIIDLYVRHEKNFSVNDSFFYFTEEDAKELQKYIQRVHSHSKTLEKKASKLEMILSTSESWGVGVSNQIISMQEQIDALSTQNEELKKEVGALRGKPQSHLKRLGFLSRSKEEPVSKKANIGFDF